MKGDLSGMLPLLHQPPLVLNMQPELPWAMAIFLFAMDGPANYIAKAQLYYAWHQFSKWE